ncbi:MAG: hypothetical protein ACOC8Y_03370 [Candidatus Natronoplasma sp.]
MRKVKLDEWVAESPKRLNEKRRKGRPTPRWKLADSMKYIEIRDKYLRKKGKKKFELNL